MRADDPAWPAPPEGGSTVRSVLTALDLLDCFADSEELGVTEIARRLGVARSTAHRLLTTLCARGVAERTPGSGHYRLGLHLYELGLLAQDREPLRRAALPVLEQLRAATGLSVRLSIADRVDVLRLELLAPRHDVAVLAERQRRVPLHASSAGKVLAAHDPLLARARELAGLPRLTAATLSTPAQWASALDHVRRRGFAVSDGECVAGWASVGVPVRDATGEVRAAVSVAGPSRVVLAGTDRLHRVVAPAAARIARRAAGRPAPIDAG